MALEATFRELYGQLKKLQDSLLALRITVSEDKPIAGEAALVDRFEDSLLDMMGSLDDCLKQSRVGQKAVDHQVDLDRARRALTVCQQQFHRAELIFSGDLVDYQKLRELARLAVKRGGEWRLWATSVKHGLEQCQPALELSSKALAACWQEIAERVGTTNISVQATNIGQKIVGKASELEDILLHEET